MRIDSIDIVKSFTKFKNNQSILMTKEENSKNSLIFIYGPNGTGKTSLSKLFYLANLKLEGDLDYKNKIKKLKTVSETDDLYVSVCYSNESKTIFDSEEIENPIKIPTFNRDYIDSKITYQRDFKNNKFNEQALIYGIEFESKTNYQNKINEYNIISEKGIKLAAEIKKKIEDGISQIANEIGVKKNNNAFINYNIDNFEKMNENEIPSDLKTRKKEHIALIQNLRNIDENDKVNFNVLWLDNIDELKNRINKINNILSFNEDKAKLSFVKKYLDNYSDEEVEWKLKGTNYIKDNKCPFCNNDISSNNIIEIYNNYLNSAVKETEDFIKCQLKDFNNQKKILEDNELNFMKSKKVDELFNSNILENMNNLILRISNLYNAVISNLEEKLTEEKLYIDCSELINKIDLKFIDDIKELYERLKKLIISTNNKIEYSNKERISKNSTYLLTTGKYIIFESIKDELKELKLLREEIKKVMKDKQELEKKYKEELKDKNELLNTMNTILDDFTITNYRVNETFDLCLDDIPVSFNVNEYLSDGEKNIIALTLFIAELKLFYSEEEKRIIFIDDPVTSIDYPNLYGIYVYITEIINKNPNSQIIITSHNTTFLNLFKFHFKKANFIKLKNDKNDKTIWEDDNRNFDTSYMERLKEVYKICKEKNIDFKQKLYIHNYCRYIIETISRFEYPNHNNDADSSQHFIDLLINKILEKKVKLNVSTEKLNCLKMIINKGSHATIENVLDDEKFEDSDYINCCDVIIKYIKNAYEGQYSLLVKDYNDTFSFKEEPIKTKEQT